MHVIHVLYVINKKHLISTSLILHLFTGCIFMVLLFLFSLIDSKVAGHADTLLQKRFHDLGSGTEAFSSVQYVGTQTITPPTDYNRLLEAVRQQVKNTHTRSPRQPGIVFQALEVSGGPSVLNSYFNVSLLVSTYLGLLTLFLPPIILCLSFDIFLGPK